MYILSKNEDATLLHMNFTETGTLLGWKDDGTDIIPPLHIDTHGNARCGAFLCIPNFEQLPPPFIIKHGEYRKEPCTHNLPHQKILESDNNTGWGSLSVSSDWEEHVEGDIKVLTVCSTLGALSEKAYLRPGFHPYFAVGDSFTVTVGETTYTELSLPYDKMCPVPTVAGTKVGSATLRTLNKEIIVSCSIDDGPSNETFCFSFAIWSDNKKEYVCIEPVIGKTHGNDKLPTPFVVEKGGEINLVFTIEVTTTK
jgi:hypothetical protein